MKFWEVIKKLFQGDTFGSLMNAPTDSTLQVFNTCCPYCSGKTSGKTKWGYISCSFLRIQTWHLKLFCLDIPLSECLKYRPAMDSNFGVWKVNCNFFSEPESSMIVDMGIRGDPFNFKVQTYHSGVILLDLSNLWAYFQKSSQITVFLFSVVAKT